jgi:hypothetical protein
VHVIRDPLDNLVSLARAKRQSGERFWGTKIPGWRSLCSVEPTEQAAHHMKAVLDIVESDSRRMTDAETRYIQVRYEALTDRPVEELRRICRFCDLPPAVRVEQALSGIETGVRRPQLEQVSISAEAQAVVTNLRSRFGYQSDPCS